MLDVLVTSKTRIKLLLKFFLNSQTSAYLRSLECEFGESTNAIRLELNRFEQAGFLESFSERNRKMFRANTRHPMFSDIQNIIRKFIGIDLIIEKVIKKLGEVDSVYVTGDFANGKDSSEIDLIIIANHLNTPYLDNLISKTEPLIKRKVSYHIINGKYEKQLFVDDCMSKLLIYSTKK